MPVAKPLLPRVPVAQMPKGLQDAWQRSMDLRGDATFFEVFANHPELYDWYRERFYEQLFGGGQVPRQLKELARYRLSTLHGCKFCNQGNRADALAAGCTSAQLDRIDERDSDAFSDQERAVLWLAEELALTKPDGALDRALFERLSAHFTAGQILELGMTLGLLAGMAKFMFAFDLVEREPSCPFKTPSS